MALLAMGSAILATFLVLISIALLIVRLLEKFRSQESVGSHFVHSRLVRGLEKTPKSECQSLFIWRLTALLGTFLTPFVTWAQRRRLSALIERAGMLGWQFNQIYCLQGLSVLTCLMIALWWIYPSLHAAPFILFISFILLVSFGWWLPIFWLKRKHRHRLNCMSRLFPFFLDMVGLGLDAGLNLQASVQLALEHVGSGPLYQEWSTMLADMRAGQSRAQALRQLSQRLDLTSLRQLISSLIQGEAMGFSLGRIIQVYADQQRAQRLMQAEKQALRAPVKMLFPMALCIFPCTFIVLGFPVVIQLLGQQ